MATINSEKFAGIKHFSDPSAWVGGVVPTGSGDIAIIESAFTQINDGNGVRCWAGVTSSIRVDTTSGFPATSGSFYAYTYQTSDYVKIDYDAVNGDDYFTNCTIDHTYVSWSNAASGSLRDGKAYGTLRNNAPVFRTDHTQIVLSGSNEWVIGEVRVRDHGCFTIKDTATIKLDSTTKDAYIEVEDGKFEMKDQTTAILTGSTERNSCLVYKDGFDYSQVIVSGSSDLRKRTTVSSNVASGSGIIPVASSTGFAAGDIISVYSDDDYFTQKDNRDNTNSEYDPYYYNATGSVFPYYHASIEKDEDEVLYVRSVNGNNLNVSKVYANEGTIISASAAMNKRTYQRAHGRSASGFTGNKTSIQVRSENNQFEVGQKVLIGNSVYTILEAGDKLIHYKTVDFTAGANLNDFYIDTFIGSGSSAEYKQHANVITGSRLEVSGSVVGTNSYYHNFFLKNTKLRDYKVTVTGSLLRQATNAYGSSGDYNGNRMFAVIGNANPYDRGRVRPFYSRLYYARESYIGCYGDKVYYGNRADYYNDLDSDKLILSSSITSGNREGDVVIEMSNLREHSEFYYQGQLLNTGVMNKKAGTIALHLRREGACIKKLTVEEYVQELVLDTTDSISVGTKIYHTGTEVVHPSGQNVVKLMSTITNLRGFTDIARGYSEGTDITTTSPIPIQLSNNGDTDLYQNSNTTDRRNRHMFLFESTTHDDGHYQVDTTGNGYWDINLGQNVTLDAIGIAYYYVTSNRGNNNSLLRVGVEYSSDGSNWSTAKTNAADPRLSNMAGDNRIYQFTQITARFLRIHVGGTSNNNRNYINHFSIYNFNGRGNTIEVNNSSDIAVNDTIAFYNPRGHRGQAYHSSGLHNNFRSEVLAGNKSLSDYPGSCSYMYTVTGKSGNVLTLDRLIEGIEIHHDTGVMKMDRAITVKSAAGTNNLIPFGLYHSDSSSQSQKIIFNNVFAKSLGGGSRERMYKYAYSYSTLWELSNCALNAVEQSNDYSNASGEYRKNNVWITHGSFANAGSRMYKDHKIHGEIFPSLYNFYFRNVHSTTQIYSGNFVSGPRYFYVNSHSTPYDAGAGEFVVRNNVLNWNDYMNLDFNSYNGMSTAPRKFEWYDNVETAAGNGYKRHYSPYLRTESSKNKRVEGSRQYPKVVNSGYIVRTEGNFTDSQQMGTDYLEMDPYFDKLTTNRRPYLVDNGRRMIIRNRDKRHQYDIINLGLNRVQPILVGASFSVHSQQAIRVQQKMTYKHNFGTYFNEYLGSPESTNNNIRGLLIYKGRTVKGDSSPVSMTYTDFSFDESFTAEPGNYLYIMMQRSRAYTLNLLTFKNMSFSVTGDTPDHLEIDYNGFEAYKVLNRPDKIVTATLFGNPKAPKKLATRGVIKLRKFKF